MPSLLSLRCPNTEMLDCKPLDLDLKAWSDQPKGKYVSIVLINYVIIKNILKNNYSNILLCLKRKNILEIERDYL